MDKLHRFSGRQITVMVVAISVAVVLAPVGAVAATGSLVNVTDPVYSTYRARVTSKGSLAVTPRDPVSGVQARVNSSGQQLVSGSVSISNHPSVTGTVGVTSLPPVTGSVAVSSLPPVTGTVSIGNHPSITGTVGVTSLPPVTGTVSIAGRPDVTTHAGIPGTPFSSFANIPGSNGNAVTVPAGHTLVIQSISVRVLTSSSGGVECLVDLLTAGSGSLINFAPQYAYTDGSTYYYDATVTTQEYADAGSSIFIQADGPAVVGSIQVSIAGYLI